METLAALSDKHRKLLASLHQRKHRDDEKCFLAEGPTLVHEVLRSSYTLALVVLRHDQIEHQTSLINTCKRRGIAIEYCSARIFEQISDAASPQGVAAVVRYAADASHDVDAWQRVVALDGVQDPGNVGTIIRTAHFFGFNAVLLGSGSVDRYNPKLIRSTMGSIFHIPVLAVNLSQTLRLLRTTHSIYGAMAHNADDISQCATTEPLCVVIGAEAAGISEEVGKLITKPFTIASQGSAESLNAAIAAGISLYHFAGATRS